MRISGGTVGTGTGVAVLVGGGVADGVEVAEGVAVGPRDTGKLLQAVRASAIRSPKVVRKRFMGVLILVNRRRVNGREALAWLRACQAPHSLCKRKPPNSNFRNGGL